MSVRRNAKSSGATEESTISRTSSRLSDSNTQTTTNTAYTNSSANDLSTNSQASTESDDTESTKTRGGSETSEAVSTLKGGDSTPSEGWTESEYSTLKEWTGDESTVKDWERETTEGTKTETASLKTEADSGTRKHRTPTPPPNGSDPPTTIRVKARQKGLSGRDPASIQSEAQDAAAIASIVESATADRHRLLDELTRSTTVWKAFADAKVAKSKAEEGKRYADEQCGRMKIQLKDAEEANGNLRKRIGELEETLGRAFAKVAETRQF